VLVAPALVGAAPAAPEPPSLTALPPQSTATRDPNAANNSALKAKEAFIEAHLIREAGFRVYIPNRPDAYPLSISAPETWV